MTHAPDDTAHTTRRTFLRLSLALPALAVSVALPLDLLAATLAPVPGRKPKPPRLLMIDPGHGGHDPGAIGVSGTEEKHVTLDIARRLAEALGAAPSVDARLTRNDDVFLPLPERVTIGHQAGADLFLSIHADSAPNPAARGLSAYTLSDKASDAFAGALAQTENQVDGRAMDFGAEDKDVAAILYDLTARRTRNTSQRAKANFVRAMGRQLRLLDNPMRSANFAVLRSPDVPSILIETGFLSNPQDEAVLAKPTERQRIADLMARELNNLLTSPLFG